MWTPPIPFGSRHLSSKARSGTGRGRSRAIGGIKKARLWRIIPPASGMQATPAHNREHPRQESDSPVSVHPDTELRTSPPETRM